MSPAKKDSLSDPFDTAASGTAVSALLFRYLPFWPIFFISMLLSLLIASIYIRYQTPLYQANATILLKGDAGGSDNTGLFLALGISPSSKETDNEIEVLRSRSLLDRVAREMGLYAELHAKGTIRDMIVYPAPVKFTALEPDLIANAGDIPIDFSFASSRNYITLNGKNYPLGKPVATPYGVFKIDQGPPEAQIKSGQIITGKFYLRIRSVKAAARALGGSLVPSTQKQSSLITLKLTDERPWRAEILLNKIIEVYNRLGIEDKNQVAVNTLNFIERRLVLVTRELTAVEGEYQTYRTRQGTVNISDEGRVFLDRVQQTDDQIEMIDLKIELLDQVEAYIESKAAEQGTVPAIQGLSDPMLSQLLERLYDSELQLDNLLKTSGENSSNVLALKSQITRLKISLAENVRSLRGGLLTQKSRLSKESIKNESLLRSVPQKERALLEISRQQGIKNNIYTFLLQKREEASLAQAAAVAGSRIVNYAESSWQPIKPVSRNIYLAALVLGIAAGVVFVFIREQFNQKVLFRAEIERVTDVPVIGEVSQDKSGDAIVVGDGKRTVVAEQIRTIRTALSYMGVGTDKKVILTTSSLSGEGKSFVSVNLASTIALTGKKVALLEFDLRKPKISKMLGIPREPGLSNYLAGLAEYESITREIGEGSGMFVLPAGAIPPNPTELMLNGRLELLMEKLKADYDYVLIDSPPIGLVTDAKILNRHADTCLYVVRHDYTPKFYLRNIQQLLKSGEIGSLSIVFNGLKSRGMAGYGYGHSYGYGYGAGYSYAYSQDQPEKMGGFLGRIRRRKNKK